MGTLIICLHFIGLTGCALNTSEQASKNIPVRWSSGFKMPDLLATSDISLNSQSDLVKIVNAPWYSKIEVTQTKIGETTFSSCSDYFDHAKSSTRTIKDSEMGAYLEFKTMCEATQLLMNAAESKKSYFSDKVSNGKLLDNDVPKIWPKDFALQISAEESKRAAQNPKQKTWSDITPIIKYEEQSETKSTYFHNGGYQELEILGYGDANGDDVEDVFIVVSDHVEGGNYFNMRLFVLSINAKKNWELIKVL